MFKHIYVSGLRWLWVSFLVLIVDRLSKIFVVENLIPYEAFYVLPFFNLTLAYNKGAAFSFLSTANGWQNIFLGVIAIAVTGFILVWLARQSYREYWLNLALCLIIAGAIGNLWDRLLYSYVIDFLDFHWGNWHFAIFNVADSAICIGTLMLIVHWLWLGKTK